MKVLTVIGNRPQFVKAAAVSRLLRAEHDELLVHTGQHHDDELSTIFVNELGVVVLARVDEHLLGRLAQAERDRGGLDELRAVPDDG